MSRTVADSTPADSVRPEAGGRGLTKAQTLVVLLWNGAGFVHAAGVAAALIVPWAPWGWRLTAAAVWLYLLPPLAARALLSARPLGGTRIPLGSRDYLTWWALLNLQALFSRFPALEEALRVVPWLYSAWLRLWGARVGGLVYWAPGVRVLDRSFLDIGRGVAFGAGVRLNPHVVSRDADGRLELVLAPVRIGAEAMIGGYALLTAGTEIAAGECTPAYLLSPPFSRWQGGRRRRGEPEAATSVVPRSRPR